MQRRWTRSTRRLCGRLGIPLALAGALLLAAPAMALEIDFEAVPEPAAATLLVLGKTGLVASARRLR